MLPARTADRDIEAAFAEGVTDYITKPFAARPAARARAVVAVTVGGRRGVNRSPTHREGR